MKQFLSKCLVYCGIILFCSVVLLRVLVTVPNKYCRHSHEVNVIRQVERMKTIIEPKIIIIGGSGCGFGLCSPMICEHFDMPVCNTGTHAGLGLLSQLNICKDYIRNGDIVIIIPEYSQYTEQTYLGSSTTLRIFSSVYPTGYKLLTFRQQLHLLQYVPGAHKDAMASRNASFDETECNPYSSKSLNEYGDVECYESRTYRANKNWSAKGWKNPKIQQNAIVALQNFNRFCIEKGATMLVFPPANKALNFDENIAFIHTIWESLENAQLPLVSYPVNYRMADTLHYDTEYHLTYEGVLVRTAKLIKDLDSALINYRH